MTSRFCVLLILATFTMCCRSAEELEQRQVLEALLARGNATRADVERELGKGDLYEKGTPGWTHLESMSRGRAQGQLREMLPKYRKILYYTSAWHITWIFFDEKERLKEFYQTAQ